MLGGSDREHADATRSSTTMRTRRDQRIAAGVFARPEQLTLDEVDVPGVPDRGVP